VTVELKALVCGAESIIDSLFAHVEGDAQAQQTLVALMDRLCAGEQDVSIKNLPKHLRKLPGSCKAVLYLASGNTLQIQSQPYCVAWAKKRKDYA
jgi:hypothetical protein